MFQAYGCLSGAQRMMNHLIWLLPSYRFSWLSLHIMGSTGFQMETVFVAEEKALWYRLG